ncbi:Non-repetitive/WGA-negative nucleoporin C-terminal-domain-containing protein [Kickxella alabastrina]|uniref:Non-repetitive/WGA-negative nucleoporin C-terminal-domain-containing protein n=1 Tax=Kickxella alabastrina TaxID=61397 RepID=UPI00222048CE|nr:Non-repetitive/WGA-negative nucleoporin C-terminal-domain-containing protein [Kickxella alabastrina]KAI7826264.1 Non-repetitive/WGA-negative nucleoporin C-terminal-domain-containing protein [Kickxella alabastrina]
MATNNIGTSNTIGSNTVASANSADGCGPVVTPIQQAAKLVESNIQSDSKFPALSELLQGSSSGDYETPLPADWQIVGKQRLIPLPDALFEQYDLLECRCFMGLFPRSSALDHRLFLWNYQDETDFYSFEDQDQIIVSVALVRPRKGVFVDTIEHVLVVATPLEVFLLGVGYSAAGSKGGSVTLYATQISHRGHGDGRVFMGGNDGALYEFAYQAEDGWLSKKARKINLTATLASYFIPTFLGRLAMAADAQRQLLYVLAQDASIRVYWLGAHGSEFHLAHHHRTVANAAALLCPQFNEAPDSFALVSIHVLVAITGGGARLYFSTERRMQRFYDAPSVQHQQQQPEVFELVHVRLPPDTQPALGRMLPNAARPSLRVHTAFYAAGTVLLAHTWSEDHDSILAAAPACAPILARMARQPRASLTEYSSASRIEGRTIVEKQRPVDMFRQLLCSPQQLDVRDFVTAYGLVETCAMCLTLLCSESAAAGGLQMDVAAGARRFFFELGGVPHRAGDSAGAFGAFEQRIVLSGRHDGLALFLARALHPLWTQPATVLKKDQQGGARLHVGVGSALLMDVQDRLRRLQHFINNNQRFVPDQINQMPVGSSSASGGDTAAECWRAEAVSLGALYELVVRSVEAISFLLLMSDFNLPAITGGLPAASAQAQRLPQLAMPFNQLVCTTEGQQSCRDLILTLISSQLRQNITIDSISDRCASLFSSAHVALYKALESLKLAKETQEGSQVADLCADALHLLVPIAGSLGVDQLGEICGTLEALGQYTALVSLALACAEQSDPRDDAVAFWQDGAPAGDAREATYAKRMACYRCIIDMLAKHPSISLPAGGVDGLFQFALFDWLLETDRVSVLFQMNPMFVEQYLLVEPQSVEKGDMLWHFYIHQGRFGRAAVVQRHMAAVMDLSLEKRLEYLSLSISNAKIALDRGNTSGDADQEAAAAEDEGLAAVLRDTEDQLEVAQVQLEIQQQLRTSTYSVPVQALNDKLYTLSELYEEFAQPHKMYEAILYILKAANHDDAELVQGTWQVILRTAADGSPAGLLAAASKVYPSAAAFPVAVVARLLVDLSVERQGEYSRGFVSDCLLKALVPHWAVFDALQTVFATVAAAKEEGLVVELVVGEIAWCVGDWIKGLQGNDIGGMPLVAVDEALSQHIVNAQLRNQTQIKQELQLVQESLRQMF